MRFAALAILTSVILGVPVLAWVWATSSEVLLSLLYALTAMVPVWSIIVASAGSPLGRKVKFLLGSLAFVIAFDAVALMTGLQRVALVTMESAGGGIQPIVLTGLYRLVVIGSGCVTLVLFVGKRPSVLWTSETHR